jgi:Arc/MetJ-type ribon-helix-helix transcriptional regulator
MDKRKSIEIPESLYNRLEAKIRGSDFSSVSEYATFLIRERLIGEQQGPETVYSKEEEERIKAKLRDLGYL